jgi:hypothetical protein
MAPTMLARKPAFSFGPYHPKDRPRKVANNAPPMPSNVVIINPPGSFPGIRSLAITPAKKPIMIAPIKCIFSSFINMNQTLKSKKLILCHEYYI